MCFYTADDARVITPPKIVADDQYAFDTAPQERWDCDVMEADGTARLKAVVYDIHQTCALYDPDTLILWSFSYFNMSLEVFDYFVVTFVPLLSTRFRLIVPDEYRTNIKCLLSVLLVSLPLTAVYRPTYNRGLIADNDKRDWDSKSSMHQVSLKFHYQLALDVFLKPFSLWG